MAPTIIPRVPSGENLQHLSRWISSTFSRLATRDVASTATPLASIFALVLTSGSSVSRRALTSLADLPSSQTSQLTARSIIDPLTDTPLLLKRQNAILAIPATYDGLNAGPAPGAVVGITLGSVFGFILILYLLLFSFQCYGGRGETVVKEEIIVKRRSHSKAKSHRSSHHSVHDSPPSPPMAPPPRRSSRRETIVEIEEEIIRHASRHPSPSPSPDQVIVEEDESHSEDIVEVIEDGSYTSVSESTAPRAPRSSSNGRRSGFRIVDPAEPGGGDAPMRRMSRRSSGRG